MALVDLGQLMYSAQQAANDRVRGVDARASAPLIQPPSVDLSVSARGAIDESTAPVTVEGVSKALSAATDGMAATRAWVTELVDTLRGKPKTGAKQ
jgi:hypothetical protein